MAVALEQRRRRARRVLWNHKVAALPSRPAMRASGRVVRSVDGTKASGYLQLTGVDCRSPSTGASEQQQETA